MVGPRKMLRALNRELTRELTMAQPVDEYAIMLNPWFGQYTDASFEQQQAEVSLSR